MSFFRKNERILITLGLALFFLIPYFAINRAPVNTTPYDISVWIDKEIPLTPVFIWIYASTYIFVFLPAFIIKDKKYFRKSAIACFFTMLAAYTIFLIFPVDLPHPQLPDNSLSSKFLGWFYAIDHPYRNNFPSLHIAFATLIPLISYKYNKKYWWTFGWGFSIMISTLFVKQHLFLDVVSGIVLGLTTYFIFSRKE